MSTHSRGETVFCDRMGNNTNAEGFSFMDILNFTGELARMQQGGGGNMNINISGDQLPRWESIPVAAITGSIQPGEED